MADMDNTEGAVDEEPAERGRKRVKTSIPTLQPQISIEGNHEEVLCTQWMNNIEVATGGYDHAIRLFDPEAEKLKLNIYTSNKVTTCLDNNKEQIISSHDDGMLRLWDTRTPMKVVKTLSGHKAWAS